MRRNKMILGFKQGLVKNLIKENFNYKFYQWRRKEVRTALKGVKWYPEELCDYLIYQDPMNLSELKKYINDWISLEQSSLGYEIKQFVLGKEKEVFTLLKASRNIHDILNEKKSKIIGVN